MKNNNGTNKKINPIIIMGIIPVIAVVLMLYSNKTAASQQDDVLITEVGNGNQDMDPISQQALTFYLDKAGDEINSDEVEVVKKNFGCHFEFHIYNNGELVMKLSYSGSKFYEI